LRFLNAVLNWAVKAKYITENPCTGLTVPHEDDPQRPMLSREEYDALQAVAMSVSSRFALALALAWETGRRIGAIRHLRWADVNVTKAMLMFRKKFDKSRRKGAHDMLVPITASAVAALSAARAGGGATTAPTRSSLTAARAGGGAPRETYSRASTPLDAADAPTRRRFR
jgi:integrase